jgi:Ca-activated chloride channel family protein
MRLTRKALELLLKRFKPQDRVSLVLAANENTRVINNVQYKIYAKKLQRLIVGIEPDGVCDFRAAVKLAYDTAVKNYLPSSGNRVVIFTDGIVKEGTGKADPILRDIAEARKRGITNTVIGVGGDGNDELLETIANKGDGSYVFIDSTAEAEKVFKRDFAARFRELARDFKIQVVFNPSVILAYRQIGYRNRQLTAKQFRDDKIDAGEVGSGQSATALYEMKISKKALDEEVGAKVYIRYKTAHNMAAEERAFTITAGELRAENKLSPGFLLAACAAEFAEYLAFPGEPDKATPSRIREVIAPSANLYDPKITTFLRLLRTCK